MIRFLILNCLLIFSLNAEDITKLTFKKDIVPLLSKYCYKCHDDDVQKGDLNMLKVLEIPDTIAKNHKLWEKVIHQVDSGEMPPKKPFMSHIERNRLLEWTNHQLKNIDWATLKSAGHVTLPRLTREEYNNTIRDLLDWDRKPGNRFGEDGIGESGFNNDRDGLFVSSSQAVKYFEAAEKLIHDYINSGIPAEKKVIEAETMLVTDELTRPRSWGWLIGRNQDTVYTFVPISRAGFYELTVRGWGRKKSSNSIPEMHILVDNKLKAKARINATPENPADYKLLVYLDEGNHQISFNAKKLSANASERKLPVNPLVKIDIFGNLPLGQSAEKLCTNGLNFMALDKISLVGPLKALPAKAPLKEIALVSNKAKGKKSQGPAFEKPVKVVPISMKGVTKKSVKAVKTFNGAVVKLQAMYNKLRALGPKADPFEIDAMISEIAKRSKPLKSNSTKMQKSLGKNSTAFTDYEKENKAAFTANKNLIAKAKKLVPKNVAMSAKDKVEFIKNYTGEQWLYCRDIEGFVNPPNVSKVFFVKPNSRTSERQAAEMIISKFATRAFRRPIEAKEVTRYLSLFDAEKKNDRPYMEAIKLPLAAILISPKFLYRTENAPSAAKEFKLDDFQLASRLSYFLWMSMPDDQLFKLAKSGELSKPAVLKSQIQRMVKDQKFSSFTKTFGQQWLGYHELGKSKVPDEMTFPKFTEDIRKDMFVETEMFLHELISKNGNMLDILDSNYTYLNERLAQHYGIRGVKGSEFRRVTLKDKMRGGVLGMGSVLTTTSQPIRTSPVDRGTWVLETLMGQHLPEPPANIPPLPETAGGKEAKMTLRQSLEKHRDSEQCASCHNKIDPIGFGLENFNPIGQWRKVNFGRKIDAQGKLPNGETFTNPGELRALLVKKKDQFARNMAERFLSFSLGRKLEFYDEPTLKELSNSFMGSNFKAHKLIEEIVMSYPFLHQNQSR